MSAVESHRASIASGIADLGGQTPLVRFDAILGPGGPTVYAKLEAFNPSGSAKDRTARFLIERALEDGRLAPGARVVESSSGNFGVAMAQQCRLRGLDFTCVVDPRTNPHTLKLIAAYGGEVHLVEEPDPETGDWLAARLSTVHRILESARDRGETVWWPNQYANLDSPRVHALHTMREIMEALPVTPDVMLVATSTTGTLGGCIQYARERGVATEFMAVDAEGSVLFGGSRGVRKLPGFGAGTVPRLSDGVDPDRVLRVSDLDCVVGCRVLAETEGYLAGASGGGVVSALAALDLPPGKTACVILADGGERYLDTVYNDEWVEDELGCGPRELRALIEARVRKGRQQRRSGLTAAAPPPRCRRRAQ